MCAKDLGFEDKKGAMSVIHILLASMAALAEPAQKSSHQLLIRVLTLVTPQGSQPHTDVPIIDESERMQT